MICNDIWLSRILAWLADPFRECQIHRLAHGILTLLLAERKNSLAQLLCKWLSNQQFISDINEYHISDIFVENSTRLQLHVSRFLDTHSFGNEL